MRHILKYIPLFMLMGPPRIAKTSCNVAPSFMLENKEFKIHLSRHL